MSSWKELDEAVEIFKGKNELIILQCTSEYPCLPANAGLNIMLEIKDRYGCPVGFSDHTLGVGVPIAAVALGAVLIEKHFTLSKLMYGSDAKNSTEPEEFKMLVEGIRAAEGAISSNVNKDDKVRDLGDMKRIFEKSIISAVNLPADHLITPADICYKKPGDGIPAREYKSIIGKKLKQAVSKNHKFNLSDFKTN
jgi:N-acetylneuraminate synthase